MPKKNLKRCAGFTLIELLVTMALTMLVVVSMYSVFESSNKNYSIQEQVIEAENNLRAAMSLLSYDLKSAGYDPEGPDGLIEKFGLFPIDTAETTTITFNRADDQNGDGTMDRVETVTYSLVDGELKRQIDVSQEVSGATSVVSGGNQTVAENIEKVEFYYYNDVASPPANPADDVASPPANPAEIRTITVSVLAVTAHPDRSFGSQTFIPASGVEWDTPPGHRGRFISATVYCRNMGL